MANSPIKKYYEYKHEADYYKRKYHEVNHLYNHFKTQFAPGHFYSPYPDMKDINKRKNEIFDKSVRDIPGININEAEQLKLLKKISSHYKRLPHKKGKQRADLRYKFGKHAYSYTDAVMLFCMMQELKPRKIIEIGSGYSSAMMLDINEIFFDNKINLTFVEPYPELFLSLTKEEDKKNYTLLQSPLDKLDNKIFEALGENDILFIDSTHVSKAGSDVNQIFFNILPLLKKGVIVHIHDVFYPFEYPYEWIKETRAWNEDYLLRAYLHNNKDYEILIFNDYLKTHHESTITKLLPLTKYNSGGSLWLKKVAK